MSVPDELHVATSSVGSCTLPGLSLFTLADALLLGMSVYLIGESCAFWR